MNVPVVISDASSAADAPSCPNCREPLLGEFCYACGQPRKGFIRHLSGIIGDFLDTVFNIDSRTLRTIFPLFFRPGFLSLEYFAGRRVRYVTPLRLYFFISVLAFLAVSAVTHFNVEGGAGDFIIVDDKPESGSTLDAIEKERSAAIKGLQSARKFMGEVTYQNALTSINERFDAQRTRVQAQAANTVVANTVKTVTPAVPASSKSAATPTPTPTSAEPINEHNPLNIVLMGGKPWDPKQQPIEISWLNEASNHWLTDRVSRMMKNAKLAKDDPDRFIAQAFSLAPQTLFLLLPLFALLLKAIYLFKRRLYMEHLIVALHSHSFVCFSILLLAGISALGDYVGTTSMLHGPLRLASTCVLWWMPIYLLLAQKRVYGQGWIMTLIKYSIVGIAYTLLISVGIVFNMMLSLASL